MRSRGQRMVAQIGILLLPVEELLLLQDLEELQEAARRLVGAVEEASCAAWSAEASCAIEKAMKAALADALRRRACRPPPASALWPATRRRGARHHGDDARDRGVVHRLRRAREMAAGDVAGLVRHDADELVGRLAAQEGAGVEEQVLAAGDEGIERRIVDDVDMHRLRVEAGDSQDRRPPGADDAFDLRVANERQLIVRRRPLREAAARSTSATPSTIA